MSNQESNNQKSNNNEVKYYSSVHAETGFLTALTLVESSHGSDYYAIKFNASRGNSNEPSKAPHSVRVNGVQAKEVIEQVADKIKATLTSNKKLWDVNRGKETASILIGLNVSDTVAKSYMNKHEGKEVCYIDGRCTSIAYVRIGDEVVFQKNATKSVEEVADKVEVETDKVNTSTQEAVQEDLPVDVSTGELEQEIALDPTADNFQARRTELKELGYSFNSEKKVWSL